MAEENKNDPTRSPGQDPAQESLVDELKVKGLRQGIIAKHGRFLSAAGRQSPVAEFGESFLVMHPPQKPFFEEGPTEEIVIHTDNRGILLDEQGKLKKIAGAKYKGQEVYWLGEQKPGTLKYLACYVDDEEVPHKLFHKGEPATTEIIFRLRNKSIDGELSTYEELQGED